MGRRILNDALRTIVNAERRGKASVELKPISTVMSSFLRIMKEKGLTFIPSSSIYRNKMTFFSFDPSIDDTLV